MNNMKQINNKSIKKRIIVQFSALIGVVILSMISFVAYFVTENMIKEAKLSLENRVDSIQNKIEYRLDYLIESTKLLAKNELMVNALIDDEGRREYLTPLVENFLNGKNVVTLSVVDFDGKVIFKTQDKIPQYQDSAHLRRSLAMGETTYYLNENKNHMVVMSPIKYYDTTQGSLIAEFDLNKIIDKYKPNDTLAYIKLFKNDVEIYSNNFNKNETYYSFRFFSSNTPIFTNMELAFEMGVLESYYNAPVNDAVFKLSLLGFVLLTIGIFISYLLSVSVTNPILRLYNRVRLKEDREDYQPLGTDDELETLAEAFYQRTKQLQHSEKIYANLYNNSPDMYLSVDINNASVTTCNKTLLDKLGYKKEEIIGREFFTLFHPDSSDDLHKIFYLLKTKEIVDNEELKLKQKDGAWIYVLFSVSSVRDNDGNILHTHATMRDITERKLHEKQMKENETLLFQQSKMASMGEMIGNIAHQWRQPLSTISMSSANMRASVELEDEITNESILKCSKNIEEQCQYLSKTIDDFRNFFIPNKEKNLFNIRETIDKTIKLVSASFKTHEIEVIEDLKDIEIISYENELTQAILNVIKNAKDVLLTIKDAKRLIFIKTYVKDNTAYIEIQDSGGGIQKAIIDKIFEPYFTTKHRSQGTGIGLYMTESIITKHLMGSMHVDNVEYEFEGEKYKGAKFTIEIPMRDAGSQKRQ